MGTLSMVVLLVLMVPVMGALLMAMPYLVPKGECFAVTVPVTAYDNGRLRALRWSYLRALAVVTLVCTVACVAAAAYALRARETHAYLLFNVVIVVATLALALASFALMLRCRRRVRALKRAEGWEATHQRSAALVAEGDVPGAVSLAWNLLYVPVLLFVLGLAALWYPQMPGRIALHMSLGGELGGFVPKSPAVVMGFPAGFIAFMGLCLLLCQVVMRHSKRPTHPGAPVTSALAYGLFVRAQSVFALVTGLGLSLVVGVGFVASAAGLISLGAMAALIVVACVPVVVGSIVLSVVYGQSGSRLFRRMQAAGEGAQAPVMPADDDAHWRLGVLYFNPDDASLWLPERFGIGWTINLARPAAWAFMVGFAALIVLFAVLCVRLAG